MNGESFYVIVVGLGLVDKPKSEFLHVVQNDKKEKHIGALSFTSFKMARKNSAFTTVWKLPLAIPETMFYNNKEYRLFIHGKARPKRHVYAI
jgi:hypothetical protein